MEDAESNLGKTTFALILAVMLQRLPLVITIFFENFNGHVGCNFF